MKLINFSKEFFDVKIANGVYFDDERGSLKKTMFGDELNTVMGSIKEVICSTSNMNVIRGLHFQKSPSEVAKFVTCVSGEIIDVFLDVRIDSKTFGQYRSIKLQENDKKALFIPKGFGHGFKALSNVAEILYLQSGYYNKDSELGINPLTFGYNWEIKNPIVSDRDLNLPNLSEFNLNE